MVSAVQVEAQEIDDHPTSSCVFYIIENVMKTYANQSKV